MKSAILLLLAVVSLQAQGLQVLLHTPGNSDDGTVVGSTFSFPDTSLGDSSTVTFRLKNTSTTQVFLVRTVYSASASFPVGAVALDKCIAAGAFEDLTVSFTPQAADFETAPLQIASLPYSVASGCPATPPQNFDSSTLTTLQGNGTAATYTVSASVNGGTKVIDSGETIDFGQVIVGVAQSATITLQNASSATLPLPTPAVQSGVFTQSPFSLGSLSALPATLAPGESASFTVSFAPPQQALLTSTLVIGSRSYALSGVGIPGVALQSLLVSYTLPTGVHYNISSAPPVDFGSSLTGSSKTFIFTVSNPVTNFNAQVIPSVTLSGSGFTLASVPVLPLTLNPGDSTAFNVVFSPSHAGAQSATLSIGTLQFALTGSATANSLNPQFQFIPSVLSSQQQAQLSIQIPHAQQSQIIGALSVAFNSAVTGISDDPAILFVSPGGRNANATFAAGATSATFNNGDNSITFQTGTTAGTLTFTLTLADGEVYTQSADITPAPIQVLSATATRQSPYVVLDLTAFDNTYSANKLVFNFYDSTGALMTPGGIAVDGTTDFHQYFFNNNQAGGAFTLQAKFPVTGDITTVTAADITVQNSSGQSQTKKISF
jgi:hypothetical protein